MPSCAGIASWPSGIAGARASSARRSRWRTSSGRPSCMKPPVIPVTGAKANILLHRTPKETPRFHAISNEPQVILVCGNSGASVRSGPRVDSGKVGELAKDERVAYTGKQVTCDGRPRIDQKGVENVNGYLFMLCTGTLFSSLFPPLQLFFRGLALARREAASGAYGLPLSVLAMQLADVVLQQALPCVFVSVTYRLIDPRHGLEQRLGAFLLVAQAVAFAGASLGYLIACLSPDSEFATVVASRPVWKSIRQPPRHRADAVTGTTSRWWREDTAQDSTPRAP